MTFQPTERALRSRRCRGRAEGAPSEVGVQDDLRKCMVFIGFADDQDRETGIRVVGTGFFVDYENFGYLVTARHIATFIARFVAKPLDHTSFVVRVNHKDGTAKNLEAVDVQWVFHPDKNVDLAVVSFDQEPPARGFDYLYLPQDSLLTKKHFTDNDIGIGDTCYAVGLFRVLRGKSRNIPVVRVGSIALLPGDEKLPAKNSEDERLPSQMIDACLAEFQGLQGMSGSPVFVRPGLKPTSLHVSDRTLRPTFTRGDLFLFGILQAPWDAPSTEIVAADRTRPIEVPAGMGVVISSDRIVEVLEMPVFKEQRAEFRRLHLPQSTAQ